jgi:hypothetical protein
VWFAAFTHSQPSSSSTFNSEWIASSGWYKVFRVLSLLSSRFREGSYS